MRRPLLVLAASTALLLAGAGTALAADVAPPVEPSVKACADARIAVNGYTGVSVAEKALADSGLAAQVKNLTDGGGVMPALSVLKTAVDTAVAADNAAHLTADSAATAAAKAALTARLDLIAGVQAKLTAATKAVADAKVQLGVLVKASDAACAAPAVVTTAPTSTPTPGPTSTPTPSAPAPAPALLPALSQVTEIPVGAAETGDGSSLR
jgi:phage protein D